MTAARAVLGIAFACLFAACGRSESPAVAGAAPALGASPTAPAASPADLAPDVPMFTFEDVAGVAFGATPDELAQAWPGGVIQATGEPQGACHFAYAAPPVGENYGIAFVFDAGRLVRVDVDSPAEPAPGGGRVGMSAEQVRAAYPGLADQAHRFVPGARNLVVTAPGGASRLVFEVNPSGHVTAWHLGLAPTPGAACA